MFSTNKHPVRNSHRRKCERSHTETTYSQPPTHHGPHGQNLFLIFTQKKKITLCNNDSKSTTEQNSKSQEEQPASRGVWPRLTRKEDMLSRVIK